MVVDIHHTDMHASAPTATTTTAMTATTPTTKTTTTTTTYKTSNTTTTANLTSNTTPTTVGPDVFPALCRSGAGYPKEPACPHRLLIHPASLVTSVGIKFKLLS